MESSMPGVRVETWFGIAAPSGTPRPIIERLNRELVRVMALPDVKARLAQDGTEAVGNSSAEFAQWLRADIAKWNRVIKAANIRGD